MPSKISLALIFLAGCAAPPTPVPQKPCIEPEKVPIALPQDEIAKAYVKGRQDAEKASRIDGYNDAMECLRQSDSLEEALNTCE